MAGKLMNMSKVKQIIRLIENGVGLRTISRSLGVSRNTVKKYLQQIEAEGHSFKDLLTKDNEELEQLFSNPDQTSQARYEALEKMFPYIEKELKRTGVNRWILWAEYKEKHLDGYSYPHFCSELRQWIGTKGKQPNERKIWKRNEGRIFNEYFRNWNPLLKTVVLLCNNKRHLQNISNTIRAY